MPDEEQSNQHWSPQQPKNWTGVFGEPKDSPPGPSNQKPDDQVPGSQAPAIAGGLMPLRPLRLTEVIGISWQIVRKNLRACFGIAGTAAALVGTVELIVLVSLQRAYPESVSLGAAATELIARGAPVTADDINALISSSIPNVASTLTGLVLLQVAAFLVAAVLSQVVAASVVGKPIGGGEAWRMTRGKVFRLVAVLVASTVLLIIGFGLPLGLVGLLIGVAGPGSIGALVVGLGTGLSLFLGIFIFIRLILSPVVASLESTNVIDSLKRSFSLVKGSSWRVFGAYLLGTLLANALGFLIAFPFLLFAGDGANLTSQSVFFTTAGSIVSYLVVLAFVSVVLAVIYTELRIRKEDLASALTKVKR